MSRLETLAGEVAQDVERRLAEQMKGFAAAIIRSYLPQQWVFVTEKGTVSLSVSKDGKVRATNGPVASPDVTIEIGHDRLVAAFATRDRSKVPPGPMGVSAHTAKGRTAFDFLRGRLGL
jgi:hypothetical protein